MYKRKKSTSQLQNLPAEIHPSVLLGVELEEKSTSQLQKLPAEIHPLLLLGVELEEQEGVEGEITQQ